MFHGCEFAETFAFQTAENTAESWLSNIIDAADFLLSGVVDSAKWAKKNFVCGLAICWYRWVTVDTTESTFEL